MPDDYMKGLARDQTAPARKHFPINLSDSVNIDPVPQCIYCQADGTAQVVDEAGQLLPYDMVKGQILPFRGVRINATNTTGTFYGWTA